MGFKENLREELSYQGLLIKELASKANLNQRSLSNYLRENSSIPAADVAVKIAKALNVSVEYLVTGTDTQSGLKPYNINNPKIRNITEKLKDLNERDLNIISSVIDAMH
ncbi:MAG: helix-turn-helix transcriptional regulator [Spirochaetaceae bacterium]|nr:helix-turn-helix transcriptional regulator [Spirochaetaceae bacterium]